MHWWPHYSQQLSWGKKCTIPTWFSWWTLRSCITWTSLRSCTSTGTWWTLLSNQPWRKRRQPRRAWRALKACDKKQDKAVWFKKKKKKLTCLHMLSFTDVLVLLGCICKRGTVLKCLQYTPSVIRFMVFILGEHIWGWELFFIGQHKDKLKEMNGAPLSYNIWSWEVSPPKANSFLRWNIIFLWASGNTDKRCINF